jgi:hypothetical protein
VVLPEFTVQPRVRDVQPEHPAALRAAKELHDELLSLHGLHVDERHTSSEGAKGAMSDLVLALGGPVVISGVVAIFRLWLQRDAQSRSITLHRIKDGKTESGVEIQGVNVSDQTIREALSQMLDQDGAP